MAGRPDTERAAGVTPGSVLAAVAGAPAILGAWIASRTLAECQAVFDGAGVPAIKVHDIADILADPQYAAREMVLSVEAPGEHGHILQPGIVPRLSETPGRVRMRGPHLGEHNDAVFASLGYGPEEVERLKAAKAI